jgi:diguanylate cyclase
VCASVSCGRLSQPGGIVPNEEASQSKAIMKSAMSGGGRAESRTARAGNGSARGTAIPAMRVQRERSELGDIRQALAISRRDAQVAREHVQSLTEINSRLNQELIELARREAQVRDFAYHDELTGLPNRRLLLDRLNQALAQAARQYRQVVLLLLDLDAFKSVNDKLGHAGGDKLLQAVAGRLTDGIRGADTACRYGGDEFLIMLPDVDKPRMAAAVWAKLKMALGEPYFIDGYEIRLTCSMGAVVYPTDGRTDEALIQKADDALYRAKARHGSASIKALPREIWAEADTPDPATFQPG